MAARVFLVKASFAKGQEELFPSIRIVLVQYSKQLITIESKAPLLYQI